MANPEGIEILWVEDNPNDIELSLLSLKKHNLANRVYVVEDGAEALDYLFCKGNYATRTSTQPKVIFLDLKLPKVSGLDVLKTLRADESTRRIPVVVLTSSQEERDVVQSYDLGVNSYVVKPIDFSSFATVIAELGFYWLVVNNIPSAQSGRRFVPQEPQGEDQYRAAIREVQK